MIVLDTSVLIDHLDGHAATSAFLAKHAARGPLLVPALAAWELWKGTRSPAEVAVVEKALEAVIVDSFVPAMAKLAGELHVAHVRQGKRRPTFDLMIASHALHHGCPLATRDRDYDAIERLDVVKVARR